MEDNCPSNMGDEQVNCDIWELIQDMVRQAAPPELLGNSPSDAPAEHTMKSSLSARTGSAEPAQKIDSDISVDDMMMLIVAEIRQKGIAGHHIRSMNAFNEFGMKQIVTRVFSVDGRMRNLRNKTPEDNEISEISYHVKFTDIDLDPPETLHRKTSKPHALTPAAASYNGSTYSCKMYISAEITATAHLKSTLTKVKTATIKKYRLGSIPCMTRTALCNTSDCTRETLKNLGEDPNDPGGEFIMGGNRWVIDAGENLAPNTPHVYKNRHKDEVARCLLLSKPGDAFENSYQTILRYLQSGAITVEITTGKFEKINIPFYLVFRALGMTRDKEIMDHIVCGVNNQDPVTRGMLNMLEKAFRVPDPKFEKVIRSVDSAEIIQFIAAKVMEKMNADLSAAKKDDNIQKYINVNVLNTIDRCMFPHVGSGPEHRAKKLRYLAYLINKLLGVYMGIYEATDRDEYKGKRVSTAGLSFAKAFKTYFNLAVVQDIKKHLIKDFKSAPFTNVSIENSVKTAINNSDIEGLLERAIVAGNKEINTKKAQVTNRISSQAVHRKNEGNLISTLNTISAGSSSASKQNERADLKRRVQPNYWGFICPSQSPESGEDVGNKKQFACTASVCDATNSFVLKDILSGDPELIPLDNVAPSVMTAEKLAKVFVNGDLIGCCKEAHSFARKYRLLRRQDKGDEKGIRHTTTICWEPLIREVQFWTDAGRLIRPLVIVYNNLEEYIENWRTGDKTTRFKQWIKLTKHHIVDLRSKKITMEDLRLQQVIEYITPGEQGNTLLARNIDVLREDANNVRRMYTHCDIDQAIFGLLMLCSPMSHCSNTARNTFCIAQRKQATGWFATSYPWRFDKNTAFQHYVERPLVSALGDLWIPPTGQNCMVALALHGGVNQEDSITVNGSSADNGMFMLSFFNNEKTELEEKNEKFGDIQDYARTLDINREADFSHVSGGFIKKGTLAQKGYVLIVKTAKITKPTDKYQWTDKSIIYKRDEPAYICSVSETVSDNDVRSARVGWRAHRPITVGDKLSSRTGNKGICCNLAPRWLMPYTEDGMSPDLIVNAHSIPTRMAIGQIIEGVLATLAVRKGCHIDATAFRNHDLDGALKELEKYDIPYGGHRRMYNGRTGEWIDAHIFMCQTVYQRLMKFVVDEHYATIGGPTSASTRQPVDGKSRDGGLRIGEMEKDVIISHGTSRTLGGKFGEDSDGITIYICASCGCQAVVNEQKGIYKCKTCGDAADIAAVNSCWVPNVIVAEASAMNIRMQFGLERHTYAKLANK